MGETDEQWTTVIQGGKSSDRGRAAAVQALGKVSYGIGETHKEGFLEEVPSKVKRGKGVGMYLCLIWNGSLQSAITELSCYA